MKNNLPQLLPSKEQVCPRDEVAEMVKAFAELKRFGEIRIRIMDGKIKEATYSESRHFDDHQ